MKTGDKILILPSCALSELRLGDLAGIQAIVSEIVEHNGQITGCWVTLPVAFMNEKNWFIPYSSIV